jgi:geranylgeranyl diphosphate synthase, type II
MSTAFEKTLEHYRNRIEKGIDHYTPKASIDPVRLHSAMRYSLNAGGKRLRPILLLMGHAMGHGENDPIPAAIALEWLHTGTLIHDDLPIFDNSDLRRGVPSCHKKFDEATALLAGNSLMINAFRLICEHYMMEDVDLAVMLAGILSDVAGSEGLMAGQMEDIESEKGLTAPKMNDETSEKILRIYANKTARLLGASLEMGLLISGAEDDELQNGLNLGLNLGMAFQLIDDILDVTASSDELGKTAKRDADLGKLTYPEVYGIEKTRELAAHFTDQALELCESFSSPKKTDLVALIRYLLQRKS